MTIVDFPLDTLKYILGFLEPEDRIKKSLVCKLFKKAVDENLRFKEELDEPTIFRWPKQDYIQYRKNCENFKNFGKFWLKIEAPVPTCIDQSSDLKVIKSISQWLEVAFTVLVKVHEKVDTKLCADYHKKHLEIRDYLKKAEEKGILNIKDWQFSYTVAEMKMILDELVRKIEKPSLQLMSFIEGLNWFYTHLQAYYRDNKVDFLQKLQLS